MKKIIAFLSQKGGVGKSTLARAISTEASKSGLSVMLADLDTQQGTASEWHKQRVNNDCKPIDLLKAFDRVSKAIKAAHNFDLLVIDGAPRASSGTLEAAQKADLTVLPCCASRDDLVPGLILAHELETKGVPKNRIVFALVRVSTKAEISDAREYITQSGFTVLDGCLYEKPAYRQAQNRGLAVTETRYKSLNEKANELLDSMLSYLMEEEN